MLLVSSGLVACDDSGISALTVSGKFDPTLLDFGDVPVGMSRTMTASLHNTGTPIFTIDNVEVPRSFTLPGIKTSLMGKEIAPGDDMGLDVAFISMTEGEVTGDLVIDSGATKVTLKLRANGVQTRVPVLAIDPTSLDFGDVELNTEQARNAIITNTGNAVGTIMRVDVDSSDYRFDGPPAFDVPEGGQQQVRVVFKPTTEGPHAATMTFVPAGFPPLTLTLNGKGVVPLGEILCSPTTLDFGRVERGMSATKQVTCSARGGAARLINAQVRGSDAQYFSLVNPPGTMDLQTDQSVTIDVEYTPDGLPATHGADLQVAFSGGAGMGTAHVTLTGEVIPPPPTETAISVVLRWSSNGTDVDLHMVRPSGVEFDTSDCYYANPSPDWGTSGLMTDNPYLDVDDVDGFGPETINLSQAANGQYKVMIHYYSDHFQGPTTGTVEVYVAGMSVGTFTHNLNCDDIWTVGTVNWTGSGGTFNSTNTVRANSNHGVCL